MLETYKPADWQATKSLLPANVGLGTVIHAAPEMISTQIPAKEAARSGELHGAVFVTDFQTAGRGRRDRGWHSLPGRDLTFSVIFRLDVATAQAQMLNFAASLAVCRSLRQLFPGRETDVAIKWPNDVLINHRKICGIICEAAGTEQKLDYAVVGIGINVNRSADELPPLDSPDRPGATSLLVELGQRLAMPPLFAAVLSDLDKFSHLIEDKRGREELIVAYRTHCATLGRTVRIVTDEDTLVGEAVDIAPDGALVAESGGRRYSFHAADVVHARLECGSADSRERLP